MRLLISIIFCISIATKSLASVEVNGFATIGFTATDSKTAAIRQHISQPSGTTEGELGFHNSSLGVHLDWRLSDHWQLVSQVVFKEQEKYTVNNALQMAFIRYQPDPHWQFRLGRTGLDLFMMTDHRDIGYSFTYDHLPTEFYAIVPHQNIDGLDLKYTYPNRFGVSSLKLFYGRSKAPIVSDESFFWDVELKSIVGSTLTFDTDNWHVRANYTTTKSGNENDQQRQLISAISSIPSSLWPEQPKLLESLNIVGKHFNYHALGGRFDDADWILQSELSYIDSNSEVLNHLRAGYISIGRHFNEHTLLTTYSKVKSNNQTPHRPLISTPVVDLLYDTVIRHTNFYLINQHTISLSWRWDFSPTYAMKLQLDHTNVDSLPSAFYLHQNLDAKELDESFNTLGLSINWVF